MAKIIYKIFNPSNALYADAETMDECIETVAQLAYDFFMKHTHNAPYSIVEVQDNGAEVWRTAEGDEIPNPNEIRMGIKSIAERITLNILGTKNG